MKEAKKEEKNKSDKRQTEIKRKQKKINE